MAKLNLLQTLPQSSVSHDPSEIINNNNNLFLLSILKTVVLLNIFVETMIHFFQEYTENKRTAFIRNIILFKVILK